MAARLKQKRRGCLLFSGGLDSTMSALALTSEGVDLVGLSINYPGRPKSEIAAAMSLSKRLPFSAMVEVALESDTVLTIPHLKGTKLEGWVPYRNFLFWAIAAHKGALIGADFIAAGHDQNDQKAYSDVSKDFFDAIRHLLQLSGNSEYPIRIDIHLPLLSMTEKQQYGLFANTKNRRILSSTWSCWRDAPVPCRTCAACKDREQYLNQVNGFLAGTSTLSP